MGGAVWIKLPQRCYKAVFLCVLCTLAGAIALSSVFDLAGVSAEPLLASTVKSEVTRMMPDEVRSLVERAAATWIEGDAKAFAALFVPDGEFVVPGQRVTGVKAIEKIASEFAQRHAHVKIKIQRIIADRQQTVVEWQWEDTENSTGKQTKADDAIVIDFADGYIQRWREYIDSQTPHSD